MATKKRVYIAGPISKGDLLHNIRQSDVAFKALMKAGFAPMNPMWSCFSGGVCKSGGTIWAAATQTGGLDLTHEEWLGSDFAWVCVLHLESPLSWIGGVCKQTEGVRKADVDRITV